MVIPRVVTPCIGVCSTALGDDVCRGCKRYSHEVIAWNGYTDKQKQIIDERLDGFLIQVMSNKLTIRDPQVLAWQCQTQRVRYPAHKSPYIWLFQLLRAGAGQIVEPIQFGFIVDVQYQDVSLSELRDMVDREFYLLSEAHYQRYIGMYLQSDK
ncbi:Uncharacterised protein [Zhongshania aliphaticivorans]|uniref:Fe-S protein n=1 Tax=Zhongshania aliphaticivorans TaxID=1470434 RepID=A0A5S9NIT3_9GAMM|nr:Uncharacterised protein [Zhongshania aliphaticivorans]CAA0097111.1 Uncharacterised protein [Zhongshania aliphaticivorans]